MEAPLTDRIRKILSDDEKYKQFMATVILGDRHNNYISVSSSEDLKSTKGKRENTKEVVQK